MDVPDSVRKDESCVMRSLSIMMPFSSIVFWKARPIGMTSACFRFGRYEIEIGIIHDFAIFLRYFSRTMGFAAGLSADRWFPRAIIAWRSLRRTVSGGSDDMG